jgi:hypothetical protein
MSTFVGGCHQPQRPPPPLRPRAFFLTNDTQCFFLILSFRVKKEFEGVAAIPPTASAAASEVVDGSVGGGAASPASGGAAGGAGAGAAAAAIPGSSQYEPRLGTIQDAEGGQQLQRELDAVAASTVTGLYQV